MNIVGRKAPIHCPCSSFLPGVYHASHFSSFTTFYQERFRGLFNCSLVDQIIININFERQKSHFSQKQGTIIFDKLINRSVSSHITIILLRSFKMSIILNIFPSLVQLVKVPTFHHQKFKVF